MTDQAGKLYHYCKDLGKGRGVRPYTWVPRKENPVSCPRCKARLDRKKAA